MQKIKCISMLYIKPRKSTRIRWRISRLLAVMQPNNVKNRVLPFNMQSISKNRSKKTEWYHSLCKKKLVEQFTDNQQNMCVCLIYDLVVAIQEYKNIISLFAYLLATYLTSKNKIYNINSPKQRRVEVNKSKLSTKELDKNIIMATQLFEFCSHCFIFHGKTLLFIPFFYYCCCCFFHLLAGVSFI